MRTSASVVLVSSVIIAVASSLVTTASTNSRNTSATSKPGNRTQPRDRNLIPETDNAERRQREAFPRPAQVMATFKFPVIHTAPLCFRRQEPPVASPCTARKHESQVAPETRCHLPCTRRSGENHFPRVRRNTAFELQHAAKAEFPQFVWQGMNHKSLHQPSVADSRRK